MSPCPAKIWQRPLVLLASLLIAGFTPSTIAQSAQNTKEDKEESTEEIIRLSDFTVTSESRNGYYSSNSIGGTRLKAPIQDIPLSIQIVTDELIRDMASFRVEDSLQYVSGVALQNRNDLEDGGESYNIRGFQSRMLLRNGIPFNAFTDTINIQQIEVVKGPTSVLYGVADPGGLVNVVTKKPMIKPSHNINFQMGDWDTYRTSFDSTGPITSDKRVAYRLTGVWEEAGSFRPWVDDKRTMIDGAVAFQINAKNRIDLEYLYGKQDGDASSRRSYPTVRAGQLRYFAPLSWFGMGFTMATPHDFQVMQQQFAEATWESELSDNMKLRVVYAWTERDNDKYSNAQSSMTAAGVMNKLPQREQYVFDHQNLYVDLLTKFETGPVKHTTLAGVQTRNEEFVFYNSLWGTKYGGPLGPAARYLDPTQPDSEKYWMAPLNQLEYVAGYGPLITETETQSAFVTHQAEFFDSKLRLTGGFRYDDLKTRNLEATTPQFGLLYKFNNNISFFTSYNESFVPNTQVNSNTGKVYDPEEGKGIDVGVKFELFNRRYVGTATVFEVKKTNVVNYNSRRDPGEPEWLLSGRLRTKGFEYDSIISATESLQFIVSYAYHDAKELANEQYPDFVPYQLDNSAKHNIGIWSKYHIDSGMLKGLAFGAGYQYRKGPINLFPNGANRMLTQPSYERLDLFVRYAWKIGKYRATLSYNLKNALDELYMNKTGWWADPRNSTIGLGVEF